MKQKKFFHGTRTEESRDDWETPPYFFELLDEEFNFDIDLAASDSNHLCDIYYTKENSGLEANCQGHTVFCNPPYDSIKEWVQKCYKEGQKPDTTVVMLIPARVDTKYFHNFCMKAYEIRIVKGRINFLINGKKPKTGGNNHPSCIVIFKSHHRKYPKLRPFYHKEQDLIKQNCDLMKFIEEKKEKIRRG